MADPSLSVVMPALREGARLHLWQSGDYWEDGVRYHIGPIISQAFLDAEGRWVRGFYNALDPEHGFAIDGEDLVECDRLRGLWRRLCALSRG